MRITFEVPDNRAEFILELLRSLPFVKNPRSKPASKAAQMDTTEYLLASPANAEHLRESLAQLQRGQTVQVAIPVE
ncbi:hypothetical protein SAMN00120144_0032 [Hymenobacter roseosalivarius DSM 11622]|uniref:Uncharacterized protein n=1 Tax=Hymenobacter roseosalivarius DSM 11622 TaxID=645990 RepID=A0A1W1W0N2_9BACT|nr:hypothetical protein [Hymenobacter roseosalivarius]SMB99136.1 hypothetical protein SAMN00120144_0032 [Hymenobacter roseosalivarius DSM 11622]